MVDDYLRTFKGMFFDVEEYEPVKSTIDQVGAVLSSIITKYGEIAVPIKEVITGTRNFQNGLCVKSTLNGSYANITSIYARQQEWAESNGYDLIKSPFELYITEPNTTNTPDDYITEIYYPVTKRR